MADKIISHKIIVAGIGPGNPAYMVPEAVQAIEKAQILVGGKRALAQFAASEAGKQKTMAIGGDIPAVMDFIGENLVRQDVVVMVSGDPGYYSLLDALRRSFPQEAIQVIPGISSFQLAFARLALPWHEAELLSFHGRVPAEGKLTYSKGRLLGMLTDSKYNSHTISELLMERGWPPEAKLAICSRLSYEDEAIVKTTLGQAGKMPVQGNCVLVVIG